jgi:hypothetical protein
MFSTTAIRRQALEGADSRYGPANLRTQLARNKKGEGRDFAFVIGRRQGKKNGSAEPRAVSFHPQEAE